MDSEGEEADPKRRKRLITRVILLVMTMVILFVPVWEVGPTFSVLDTDATTRYYTGYESNCTMYSVLLEDHGVGGWYGVTFLVGNFTGFDSWRLKPHETQWFYAFSCEVNAEKFHHVVSPPEGRPRKSLFQIAVGL